MISCGLGAPTILRVTTPSGSRTRTVGVRLTSKRWTRSMCSSTSSSTWVTPSSATPWSAMRWCADMGAELAGELHEGELSPSGVPGWLRPSVPRRTRKHHGPDRRCAAVDAEAQRERHRSQQDPKASHGARSERSSMVGWVRSRWWRRISGSGLQVRLNGWVGRRDRFSARLLSPARPKSSDEDPIGHSAATTSIRRTGIPSPASRRRRFRRPRGPTYDIRIPAMACEATL